MQQKTGSKKIDSEATSIVRFWLAVLVILVAPQPSLAQGESVIQVRYEISTGVADESVATQKPAGPPAKRDKPPNIRTWVGIAGEYDSNVFLLSASRESDLEGATGADPSGRFTDMESAADVIVQPAAGIRLQADGLGGREFVVSPEIRYENYVKNPERSNLTAALELAQDLPRASRLRTRISYSPEYFAKNYLSDAVDANGDGSISRAERRYAAGKYSDLDADAAYRFRVRRAPRGGGSAARAEASVGYYSRSYEAPFASRDLSGPTVGAELGVDRGRMELALAYDFEALSTTTGTEVLILDEPVFGRDLNGNGSSTDLNARTSQQVDRSRNEHSGRVLLMFNPPGRADVLLAFEHRLRDFASDQPLDVAHRGRRDRRNEIRGEIGFQMGSGFRLVAGGRFAKQTTNRAGDPGRLGETDDYTRSRAYTAVRKRF